MISKVSTYSVDDLIFIVFVCLAILLESAIIFQTFSFRRKGTIASLLLLVTLAVVSIGLNMIFWSSLGNFSTGFQIFSAVIGIVLDVLKINFMLDISDIYSSLLNLPLSQSSIRIIDGHWEVVNDKSIKNNKLKDVVEKALKEGDVACDRDKILDYLKTEYNVSVEPHIVEDWMKEFFSYYPVKKAK